MKVIGNTLPKCMRRNAFEHWNRMTVDKCSPPYMMPARGRCKSLYNKYAYKKIK